jgi:hypothetical protein
MLRRITASILIIWALGFVWFAVALPEPAGEEKTDAVIVPTGGEGRIDRGLMALRLGWSKRMLVSGVDREVKPNEFAVVYQLEPGLLQCCVTLGFESVDTRSNALESTRWIAANKVRSVRLVTTDWHMRRAAYELAKIAPANVIIVRDAVTSRPSFFILFLEYHKLIFARLAGLWDS